MTMEGQKAKHLSPRDPTAGRDARFKTHDTSLGLKSGNLAFKKKGTFPETRLAVWGTQLNVEVVGFGGYGVVMVEKPGLRLR